MGAKTRRQALAAICVVLVVTLSGCSAGDATVGGVGSVISSSSKANASGAPELTGLTFDHAMDVQYAEGFDVYYYNDGYKLIDVHDDARYLVVPEGKTAPEGIDPSIKVLQQPIDNIYLCATASMALFDALDAGSAITMTGTDSSGWYIQAPIDALKSGTMKYAGKYSSPDYEMLLKKKCDLALESTMILHAPEVREMIEQLGIPVFVDLSNEEAKPLGRTEWVKVYGALLNEESQADAFFDRQTQAVSQVATCDNTGKTVVIFSFNSDGSVVVRRPNDYIAQSIEIAGGTYAFDDLQGAGKDSTVDMTMEQFYAIAKDADYLVYNGTIDGPLASMSALLAKSDTFADCKAVKQGNVWTTNKSMYQSTDKIADMIVDFHLLVTDGDPSQMTFLTKVS